LGALPPDPRYRLVLRTRHGAPQPLTPSAAYDDQSSYFCRGPAPVGPTLVTGLVGAVLSVCSEDTTGQWSGCGRDHCIGGRQ